MQTTIKKVQSSLQNPEVKTVNKEQIEEKARESIRERLAGGKGEADRLNRKRVEREGRIRPTTKKDMKI